MSNSGLIWAINHYITFLDSMINIYGLGIGLKAPKNSEREEENELHKAQRSFLVEVKEGKREIPSQVVVSARLEVIQAQVRKREQEIRDLYSEGSQIMDGILTHCPLSQSAQETGDSVPRIMTPLNA